MIQSRFSLHHLSRNVISSLLLFYLLSALYYRSTDMLCANIKREKWNNFASPCACYCLHYEINKIYVEFCASKCDVACVCVCVCEKTNVWVWCVYFLSRIKESARTHTHTRTHGQRWVIGIAEGKEERDDYIDAGERERANERTNTTFSV